MTSIFGRSLSFPPRVGTDGRFVWSEGEANIRESIAVILKTNPAERVGLPDFGADVHLGDAFLDGSQQVFLFYARSAVQNEGNARRLLKPLKVVQVQFCFDLFLVL